MDRYELRARLTVRAWRGWDRTATTEGITATALAEALGVEMAAGKWHPSRRVIEAARKIDRERRSRS
jgi:hypothetical protein